MNTFIRLIVAGSAFGLMATPAFSADEASKTDLKIGDTAPAFEALDDQGKLWKSADHYGKKIVVVYFYPGDFTPGCMAQAKLYKETMHKLTEQGVEVVGVSGDSVKSHELFKKAQMLNFALLADEEGTAAKKFGVPVGPGGTVKTKDADKNKNDLIIERKATAARWTFIVGKDGKIAYKNTKVTPADDAKKISEFVAKSKD